MEPLSGGRDFLVAPVGTLHPEAVVRAELVKPPIARPAGKVGLEPLNPWVLDDAERISRRRGEHSLVQLIYKDLLSAQGMELIEEKSEIEASKSSTTVTLPVSV